MKNRRALIAEFKQKGPDPELKDVFEQTRRRKINIRIGVAGFLGGLLLEKFQMFSGTTFSVLPAVCMMVSILFVLYSKLSMTLLLISSARQQKGKSCA